MFAPRRLRFLGGPAYSGPRLKPQVYWFRHRRAKSSGWTLAAGSHAGAPAALGRQGHGQPLRAVPKASCVIFALQRGRVCFPPSPGREAWYSWRGAQVWQRGKYRNSQVAINFHVRRVLRRLNATSIVSSSDRLEMVALNFRPGARHVISSNVTVLPGCSTMPVGAVID